MITIKKMFFCLPTKKEDKEMKRIHKAINKTIRNIGKDWLEFILEDVLEEEKIVLPSVDYLRKRNRALEDENLALMLSKMHLSRSIDDVTQKYKKAAMELSKKTFEKVNNENSDNGNAGRMPRSDGILSES